MADDQKRMLQQILLQQLDMALETDDKRILAELLEEYRPSDIAEVIELLDNKDRRKIFDALDKPMSAEVLEKVSEAARAELFDLFEDKELAALVSELDPDDAADVLGELPAEDMADVLRELPADESAQIRDLLTYSEDSAGGIMEPSVLSVPEDATIAEAINRIRAAEIDEDFYFIYVVDKNGKFLGDVRLRHLLTSPENTRIHDLINPDTIFVYDDNDQEQVRNIFSKNDLIVVPVLDRRRRLVGRITADRVIEVAEEEAAEDLYTMAGTDADELESMSVFRAARVRMTWLLPCLIGTAVTAFIMLAFRIHHTFVYIAAAAFAPMIQAISGNAGLQTSAIVISGLATGSLAAQSLSQVFAREVRVALLVALSCGLIGGLVCAALPVIFQHADIPHEDIHIIHHFRVVMAFGVGMFSAIMVATTLGLFLPFLFRRVGIDPAISSGPLVTTANDSISVAIYMTLTLLLSS